MFGIRIKQLSDDLLKFFNKENDALDKKIFKTIKLCDSGVFLRAETTERSPFLGITIGKTVTDIQSSSLNVYTCETFVYINVYSENTTSLDMMDYTSTVIEWIKKANKYTKGGLAIKSIDFPIADNLAFQQTITTSSSYILK